MALRHEIKRERDAVLKNGTFKEKVDYLWGYYKFPFLGTVLAIVCIVSFIYTSVTKPEIVLDGIFLNVYSYDNPYTTDDLGKDFIKSQKLDTSDYAVSFNASLTLLEGTDAESEYSNYESTQAILTQAGAGTLDFIVGSEKCLTNFSYNQVFLDLRTILNEEQIAKYEPYFRYVDGTVIEAIEEANMHPATSEPVEIPTSMNAEDLQNPIPVLLDISGCEKVTKTYPYKTNALSLGVIISAPHKEKVVTFLDYILSE